MNPLSQRDPLHVEEPEPPVESSRAGWLPVLLVIAAALALAAWRLTNG